MKIIVLILLLGMSLTTNHTQATIDTTFFKQETQQLIAQAQFLIEQGIPQKEVLHLFKQALMQEAKNNGADAETSMLPPQKTILSKIKSCALVCISLSLGIIATYYFMKKKLEDQHQQHEHEYTQLLAQHQQQQADIRQNYQQEQRNLEVEEFDFIQSDPELIAIDRQTILDFMNQADTGVINFTRYRTVSLMMQNIARKAIARVGE